MIHVTNESCAVTGPATEVLAQLTMAINSIVNTTVRHGADKAALKRVFYRMVDMAFDLEVPTDRTTIDLSFERGAK